MKTKQQKIEYIRKKAIEANPEIVALTFGCKITIDDENLPLHNPETIKVVTYGENPLGEIQVDCGKEYIKKNSIGKIIGRDITLADILLAMQEKNKSNYYSEVCDLVNYREGYWNLKDDNLNNQEEPTINFIFDLLK